MGSYSKFCSLLFNLREFPNVALSPQESFVSEALMFV